MPGTRRRLGQLQWQLPLTIAAVLVAVVVLFAWAAYREVQGAAVRAAGQRLDDVALQLQSLLAQGAAARLTETSALASDSSVRIAVTATPGEAPGGALARLEQLQASSRQIVAVGLWDATGTLLLSASRNDSSDTPALSGMSGLTFPSWLAGDTARVGPLESTGDVVWYDVGAAIRHDGRALGYVAQRREVSSSSQTVQLLTDLIGMDAAFLVGEPGGTWTDLTRPVNDPTLTGTDPQGPLRHQVGDRPPVLGVSRPISGTSWLVWVEFPLAVVLERPRAYLARITPIGLGMVLVGGLSGWALSRRITTRLRRVAKAASALADGRHHARVQLAGDDELAELGRAFNQMAASLEIALQVAQRSEESFRHLFTTNPLPMWVYDLDTLRFLEVNDAAVTRYGYSRDEFLGMELADIRPPEDIPRLREEVRTPRADLSRSGEWRHRLKDGAIIDVEITSHLLHFAGRRAALVIALDITDRKRAEAQVRTHSQELERRVAERTSALQASEKQFRTLASTAHDAIITADQDGRITYFNPGAERIFGHRTGEVLGAPLSVLIPERFHEAHLRGLTRRVSAGPDPWVGRTLELIGRRSDGTEFPAELSLASQWHDGTPTFIGIVRDVSSRKEAERALLQNTAELEAANRELEAFSYSVSHDLRAPLRGIHGFSHAMLEDYSGQLDAKGVEYLQRVCASAAHMSALIDDLLELSRATRVEMHREQVDLSRLAERSVAELRTAEPRPGVVVELTEGMVCGGDQQLLLLVMRNLVGNAWKFTAGREDATIQVGMTPGDGQHSFFVRDNGAGFEMDYVDRLFRPFQRLHSTREFPGTGVGLALVQRIIHRHGGRVWAEGQVGQGATFHFTLPDV